MKRTLALAFAACAAGAVSAARIEISQDHANALYKAGEETTFTVTVKDDAGAVLKGDRATWALDNFGSKKFASGKAELAAGNPFTVKGKLDEEGFLRLRVGSHSNSVVWGVGYDVEKIRQDEPCPDVSARRHVRRLQRVSLQGQGDHERDRFAA